ncbi:DUF1433 domain-containing protein [Terribacillus halophilus]|jgi:hypothetical protein|uniref:DUF1433 domain-containing protein n=1 Tax=Terribacillus halophilus TaxID=361279 RepID=UPI00098677F1|nr:DUF1433 domain-containing protein [Terribacillus halophilus]
MKKVHLFIFLSIISIILLGGCNVNKYGESYDEETVVQAKETAESYIKSNFKDVQSVELKEPYQSPMGSLSIEGTVNGKADFTIDFNNDFTVAMVGKKEGFPERKDECIERVCDY